MSKRKDKTPTDELFSVVLFKENNMKLFECIPDCWFLNADKTFCYWPPKGRSYKLRAMNREKPDSSWVVSACVFVSGGYGKYHLSVLVSRRHLAFRIALKLSCHRQNLSDFQNRFATLHQRIIFLQLLTTSDLLLPKRKVIKNSIQAAQMIIWTN